MRRAAGCMLVVLLALAASPARADDLLDSLGKATGLIAPPADPPDFVKNSRPSEEPAAIPVFAAPQEPGSKVKTPAELKAMGAELERASGAQATGGSQKRVARKKHRPRAQP